MPTERDKNEMYPTSVTIGEVSITSDEPLSTVKKAALAILKNRPSKDYLSGFRASKNTNTSPGGMIKKIPVICAYGTLVEDENGDEWIDLPEECSSFIKEGDTITVEFETHSVEANPGIERQSG